VATFPQWEYGLLSALGAPASTNNLTALNLWAQSEGSVTNNALATSGRGAGASTCVAQCGSSSPIYEYDNVGDGVAQMARFLGGSYYTGIVRAFQQDAGLSAIYSAINASPWCKGCQNGQYPIALSNAVGGKKVSTSPTVGGGAGGGTGTGTGTGAGGTDLSSCVVQFPLSFSTPLGSVGGCLLNKGQLKWLTGAVAIVAGLGLASFGVIMLAAYGYDNSGAKQAVNRTARTIGVGTSLLAGQPEVAAGIAATSRRGSTTRSRPRASSSDGERRAGRLESADIERQYRETVRQQGPIGPRGGSATSQRVRERQRRGTSVPGSGRPRTPEQRRRARERAAQPF
jgi:hypothetical protein